MISQKEMYCDVLGFLKKMSDHPAIQICNLVYQDITNHKEEIHMVNQTKLFLFYGNLRMCNVMFSVFFILRTTEKMSVMWPKV